MGMLFHRLKFSGLLSFGPAGIDLPMEPLTVLIGPNGSGKSNLLEAISLLQAAPRGVSEPISRTGGLREWLWKGPETLHSISLEAIVDYPPTETLQHSLTLTDQGGRPLVADERVDLSKKHREKRIGQSYYRPPRGAQAAWETAEVNPRMLAELRKEHPSEGPPPLMIRRSRRSAIEFASEFEPHESLLAHAAIPQYPALWHLKEQYRRVRLYRNWSFGPHANSRQPCSAHEHSDFLDEGGGNLPLVLSQLHGAYKKTFLNALSQLFDGIVDVQCPATGGTVGLFLEEAGNRSIPATRLSDGTLRYLCLLVTLLHPEPPPP